MVRCRRIKYEQLFPLLHDSLCEYKIGKKGVEEEGRREGGSVNQRIASREKEGR